MPLLHTLLFVELLIHYGFQNRQLLNATYLQSPGDYKESGNLTITDNEIFIRPRRPGDKPAFAQALLIEEEKKEFYLPSRQSFALPLPAPLVKRIKEIKDISAKIDGDLFFGETGNSYDSSETGKTYNKILKPLNESLNEKITIEKIARSARTLLREGGSLTQLGIALLSSEVPRRTESPMFYTNIKVFGLIRRYESAVGKHINKIIKNSRNFAAHLQLVPLTKCAAKGEIPGAVENSLGSISYKGKDPGLDSPFVPHPERLGSYLKGLKTLSEKKSDFVIDHNRKTAYAALF